MYPQDSFIRKVCEMMRCLNFDGMLPPRGLIDAPPAAPNSGLARGLSRFGGPDPSPPLSALYALPLTRSVPAWLPVTECRCYASDRCL